MEQKVIGFGQKIFLVKISKFPITAGVTCLRLRNFLKHFSKKKTFFFLLKWKKSDWFWSKQNFGKNFKISHYRRCNVSETQKFFEKIFKKDKFFFAQMEQKLICFGQNTFLFKISKIPITAGVTCFCSNGTKSDWFWSKHIFGQNFQIPHYSRCNVSETQKLFEQYFPSTFKNYV